MALPKTMKDTLLLLHDAIKTQNNNLVKSILGQGMDVNSALPRTGYTALHCACMVNNTEIVELLIRQYKANVNSVAADGAQPIHLAGLLNSVGSVRILLAANANVDAEFGEDIHFRYVRTGAWSHNFGNTMTLLTYAVLNNKRELADVLLNNGARISIISAHNKQTLLMYALDNDDYHIAVKMVSRLKDPEVVNARDAYGWHAFHYLLNENKYGDCRYDEKQLNGSYDIDYIVHSLIRGGADIYATIKGDPDTLLMNLAAYRGCHVILKNVLPRYASIDGSKALRIATQPIGDPNKFFRSKTVSRGRIDRRDQLERRRNLTVEYVVKDLVNRRTFGLPLPEDEVKLLDTLILTNQKIRDCVQEHEKNFIKGTLQKGTISYDGRSMTFYDFAIKGFNDHSLKELMKDQKLIRAFERFYAEDNSKNIDVRDLFFGLKMRVDKAQRRINFLKEINNNSKIKSFIPLPLNVIMDIVGYLNDDELACFVNAFRFI